MELQEQITALNGEKKHLVSMVENLNAEKIALDQMLVEQLKQTLSTKKDVLIKDQTINNLNHQIQELLKEVNELKEKLKADEASIPVEAE